jgi:hypothetical protein
MRRTLIEKSPEPKYAFIKGSLSAREFFNTAAAWMRMNSRPAALSMTPKDSKAKPSHELAAGTGCQSGRELPHQFGQIVSENCE